jgi:hypothetical protein
VVGEDGVFDPAVNAGDEEIKEDLTSLKGGTVSAEGNTQVIGPCNSGRVGALQ